MAINDGTTRSLQEVDDLHDDELEPDRYPPPANVLWGRVLTLGLALLFVFLIGRMSAPNGIPEADVAALNDRLAQSHQQVAALQDQIAAQAAANKAQASPAPSASAEATTSVGDKGTTYIVQTGDTLNSIASKFYGDSSLADFIAESNNLSHASEVQVDQKITIPPKP